MNRLWLKWIAVSLLALLLIVSAAIYNAARQMMPDRYAGQPQVVGLPAGFDPLAPASPYSGPHPSTTDRPADPFDYPVPIGEPGPVFPTYANELEYPYACRSEMSGLGQPLVDNHAGAGTAVYAMDANGNKTGEIIGYSKDCSLATQVYYYYRNRASGEFLPLTSETDDIDVTSVNGKPVPFVVRIETGTINRHVYVIAVIRGPDDTPEQPDLRHWNGKLIYQLRGGVGIGRRQGRIPPDYIPRRRRTELKQGFAIAYSTGNQTSNHYDMQLAEDTLARVKRQFAARYGEPVYTMAIGGSGGAIQQYLIGQNRPGLLDGGIALQSFPDMITQTTKVMDCELLEYFFDVTDAENEKWQAWSQRSWIEGFNASDTQANDVEKLRALQALRLIRWPAWSDGQTECTRSWRNLTPQIANPRYTYFASLFSPDIVERIPWTYWDNMKRIYGTDDDGYARRTYDNVGVQYGLVALKRGNISATEFLKLNDYIGGWKAAAEMDKERFWLLNAGRSSLADLSVWSHHNMYAKTAADAPAQRSEGDRPAIAAAYRSGQVFLGKLSLPLIDLRHYLEPELNMHHSLQSFSARLRMLRAQGHADSQLIWTASNPGTPLDKAVELMDRWLMNMQSQSYANVMDAKPAGATDRCFDDQGKVIASGADVWNGKWNGKPDGECMRTYPIYSHPRIEAGDNYVGDIFKCHLQAVDAAIDSDLYAPIDMSAHRGELQRVFPEGVCDYSRGDAARPDDL